MNEKYHTIWLNSVPLILVLRLLHMVGITVGGSKN